MDRRIYISVNHFADSTPALHSLMRAFADYGLGVFAILLVAGWWIARSTADHRLVAESIWAGVATLAAVAINQPIGSAIGRLRPYATIPNVHVLVSKTTDATMPSDHATML